MRQIKLRDNIILGRKIILEKNLNNTKISNIAKMPAYIKK